MAEKKEKRFIRTLAEGGGFAGPATYILVDRETGVNYLYAASGYGGGLTVLLNRDGTPVITPVPNNCEE